MATNPYAPALVTREQIYEAMFQLIATAQLNGKPAFANSSRAISSLAQIGDDAKPAFYQLQVRETPSNNTREMPRRWTIDVDHYIFVQSNTPGQSATPDLNELVDLHLDTLQTGIPPNERQTLGGLVYDARCTGRIDYRDGLLGNSAFACIPVQIITGELEY